MKRRLPQDGHAAAAGPPAAKRPATRHPRASVLTWQDARRKAVARAWARRLGGLVAAHTPDGVLRLITAFGGETYAVPHSETPPLVDGGCHQTLARPLRAVQYESAWSTTYRDARLSLHDHNQEARSIARGGMVRAARALPAGRVSTFEFHFPLGWSAPWHFAGVVSGRADAYQFQDEHAMVDSRHTFGIENGVPPVTEDFPQCKVRVVADLASSDRGRLDFYLHGVGIQVSIGLWTRPPYPSPPDTKHTVDLPPGSSSGEEWFPVVQVGFKVTVVLVCPGD